MYLIIKYLFFIYLDPQLAPFCDFTGDPIFKISVVDVVEAFVIAVRDKLMDFKTFNPDQFVYYAESKHGNMSIVVPQKIIAFMSPYDSKVDPDGKTAFQAFDYHRVFKKMNVKLVIRLNEIESYDANVFEKIGISHINIPVDHGTCPSINAITAFINAVNNCPGTVAVHCRSGLGRTGTLIAFYLMHRFGWTSRHAIAWVRMCRPGSIIASQQTYLARMRNKVMVGRGSFVNPLSTEDNFDDSGSNEKFDEHYKEKWEQDKVRQAEMRINELKAEMEKAVAVINMYSTGKQIKSFSITSDDGRPAHHRNLSIDSTLPSVCTPRKSPLGIKRSDFFDCATPKVRFEEPLTPTRKSGSITPLDTPRSPLKPAVRGSLELDGLNLKGVDGLNPLLPSTPRSILKITSPGPKPMRKPGSFSDSDFSLSLNNNELLNFTKQNHDKMTVSSPPKC